MKNKALITSSDTIENKIFVVRGHRIMFDFDLARLYEVEKRALKQSVKRNLSRFPEDFMFQLSKVEWGRGCHKL